MQFHIAKFCQRKMDLEKLMNERLDLPAHTKKYSGCTADKKHIFFFCIFDIRKQNWKKFSEVSL
jgi:hypothetical protein